MGIYSRWNADLPLLNERCCALCLQQDTQLLTPVQVQRYRTFSGSHVTLLQYHLPLWITTLMQI